MKIIQNKIQCLKCGEEIESTSVHDFTWCKCGTVAVDGGKDYLRRVGDMDRYKELSTCEFDPGDLLGDAIDKTKEAHQELSDLPLLKEIGEGDPLGIPVKIYRTANGLICIDSDPDCGGSPVMVFEMKEGDTEVNTLVDLFWHLKSLLSLPDGKRSRDRLCIDVEMGESYMLAQGERVVETTRLRVRGNLEKNDFGERTLTKKELEGE